jgi:hypothetical protein
MKKYFKVLSIIVALISCSLLPNVNAASSTAMLITIAETNPVLLERLNTVTQGNKELLNQVLRMAESKPAQLERLLDIAETDPETFSQLVTISDAAISEEEASITGIEDGSGIIRN